MKNHLRLLQIMLRILRQTSFKKKLCSFGFAEGALLELLSISFPERDFKTVPPKYGFDFVSTNSLLSVRKQISLPCFSTTEQITHCTTELR